MRIFAVIAVIVVFVLFTTQITFGLFVEFNRRQESSVSIAPSVTNNVKAHLGWKE